MQNHYKTTFVIPTYNRSENFIESYSYFLTQENHEKIRVIVMDGSTCENHAKANKEFCERNNFDYFHRIFDENILDTPSARILEGLRKVYTSTVKICDDEDINHINGVLECVDFIENNEGYVSVDGHYRNSVVTDHRIIVKSYSNTNETEDHDEPFTRLWSHLFFWHIQLYFSVFKTETLLEIFEYLEIKLINKHSFTKELSLNAIPLLKGKHKKLDVNYCIRINKPKTMGVYEPHISRFFGPFEQMTSTRPNNPGHLIRGISLEDEVKAVRDIILPYVDCLDDGKHNLLTMTITLFYFSYMFYETDWIFQSAKLDKSLDLTLFNSIMDTVYKFQKRTSTTHYNYIFDYIVGEKIAIYGAGDLGLYVYGKLKDTHKIECFIDRNFNNIKICNGLPVIPPQDALARNFDCIIIASDISEESMFNTLLECGIPEQKIFKLSSSPKYSYSDYYDISFMS